MEFPAEWCNYSVFIAISCILSNFVHNNSIEYFRLRWVKWWVKRVAEISFLRNFRGISCGISVEFTAEWYIAIFLFIFLCQVYAIPLEFPWNLLWKFRGNSVEIPWNCITKQTDYDFMQ